MVRRGLTTLLLILLFPSLLFATTYYVRTDGDDSNSGTGFKPSQAWKTISKAAASLNAGDTVYVAPGVYMETVEPEQSGLSKAERTCYIGDNEASNFPDLSPGKVILNGESERTYGFHLYDNDYITVQGFAIRNHLHYGVRLQNTSDYARIIHNVTHDNNGGILLDDSSYCQISHNTVRSNQGKDDGIGVKSGSTHATVSDNHVYNNRNDGIVFWDNADNAIVRANLCHNNGAGIIFQLSSSADIYNNISYQNGGNILIIGSDAARIYNNTCYYSIYSIAIVESSSSTILFNNISWSGGADNYAIVVSSDSKVGFQSDYNDFYATEKAILGVWDAIIDADEHVIIGGTYCPSLVDWQKNTGGDENSISSDPLFISTISGEENLHLNVSSPCIDKGTSSFSGYNVPPLDFDGEPRISGSTPDIGADEVPPLCFVATAVYGSRMAKEVKVFEKVRDEYLLTSYFGKALVSFYYKHSPKLAHFISRRPFLKSFVRVGLYPLVKVSKLVTEMDKDSRYG